MGLVLVLVLAVVALAYVLGPLWGPSQPLERSDDSDASNRLAELENRKREALAAIKEAEFDWNMNKLTREDYDAIRTKYAQIALAAMEEIQRLNGRKEAKSTIATISGYCPRCGRAQPQTAIFCSYCGAQLSRREEAAVAVGEIPSPRQDHDQPGP
ncbi:hypothetical protein HRbin30_01422 [bacterium HR30]|nr:hypothetical protein HRbin30_01422 [bacterium HR30]